METRVQETAEITALGARAYRVAAWAAEAAWEVVEWAGVVEAAAGIHLPNRGPR